jgi:hypothetical protein
MIAVVSHAWTQDAGPAAEGYLAEYRRFLAFHQRAPGFLGRRLHRGVEDPCHFLNIRYFDRVEDYESMVQQPGYADHIGAMGGFLDLDRLPPKEYVELVLSDGPDGESDANDEWLNP